MPHFEPGGFASRGVAAMPGGFAPWPRRRRDLVPILLRVLPPSQFPGRGCASSRRPSSPAAAFVPTEYPRRGRGGAAARPYGRSRRYYLLVHREVRGTRFARWSHAIHFPTLWLPLLGAAAKDPARLRQSAPSTRQVLAAAAAYGAVYACHVTRRAAAARRPPYAFMRALTTPSRRLLFWGAGVLVGVLPVTWLSASYVSFLSRRETGAWRARTEVCW